MKTLIIVLGLCSIYEKVLSVKFPNEVPLCKSSDNACIIKSANLMLKHFAKAGNSNINLLRLDPLEVPHILIEQGEESPVNVVLKFTNNSVIGISDAEIYKIKGFDGIIEQKHEIHYRAPIIQLVGPYSINGRVLILPIQGVGMSNLTILDPDFIVEFDGKAIERKNKKYLKIENTKLTFKISKLIFHLGNLYKGDKLLGDATNLFLNENWQDVFNEIKVSVFGAFSQIVGSVLNNIFQKIPYDELFAKDG